MSSLFTGCGNGSAGSKKEESNIQQSNTPEWQKPAAKVRTDGKGGIIKEDKGGNIIDIENADDSKG